MALVIDATIAGASANSYGTVAEATTYFEGHLDGATWTGATEPNRAIALVHAARQIDALRFRGEKNATTQAMMFPLGTQANLGECAVVTAIPVAVKRAQFEQSVYLLKYGLTKRDVMRAEGVRSFSAGGVVNETLMNRHRSSICTAALEFLNPYLRKMGVLV